MRAGRAGCAHPPAHPGRPVWQRTLKPALRSQRGSPYTTMATFGNVEEQLAPDPVLAPPAGKTKSKLRPAITISGLASEVFSVRFSPDGSAPRRRLRRWVARGPRRRPATPPRPPTSEEELAGCCGSTIFAGRIAATPRGATWTFRGRAERTKIGGRRRARGRAGRMI